MMPISYYLAAQVVQKRRIPLSAYCWNKAISIARREGFLHWQVAFPGVWKHWQEQHPQGGFDAVIGNPPWDRIKLQEVEWFATRAPDIARLPTAAQPKESDKGVT